MIREIRIIHKKFFSINCSCIPKKIIMIIIKRNKKIYWVLVGIVWVRWVLQTLNMGSMSIILK